MPDDTSIELNNIFTATALQALLGALPMQKVVVFIQQDASLAAMSDDMLQAALTEARDHLEATRRTGSRVICLELMLTAIHQRLASVAAARKVAIPAKRAAADSRMASWLTVAADYQLEKARAFVMAHDPQGAINEFLCAEIAARALPDDGRLRLAQVICATLGIQLCAQITGNGQWFRKAGETLARLASLPGREQEAASSITHCRQWLSGALTLIQAEVDEKKKKVEKEAEPDLYDYQALLTRLANSVERGEMSFDDAVRLATEESHKLKLTPSSVYVVTLMHRGQVDADPASVEMRGMLNLEVAKQFDGDLGDCARAYCCYTVGIAAMELARYGQSERNLMGGAYRLKADALDRARPYIEEALTYFSERKDGHSRWEASGAAQRLAIIYRNSGELEKALTYNSLSASFSEQVIAEEGRKPHLLSNLAVATGNIAEIHERHGDMDAALDGHYRAFQLFAEAGNLQYAQRALRILLSCCLTTGRFDEGVAAAERLAPMIEASGDLSGVVDSYVALAVMLGRIRPEHDTADLAEQTWQMVEQLERKPETAVPPGLRLEAALRLTHAYMVRIHNGHALEASETRGREAAELASEAADRVGTPEAKAAALLEYSQLCEVAEDFSKAVQKARMIDDLDCSREMKRRAHSVVGSALTKQEKYEEAVKVMEEALEGTEADLMNVALERYRLGKAYLFLDRVGDALHAFELAADAYESSRRVLLEEGRLETREVLDALFEHLVFLSALVDGLEAWKWSQRARGRVLTEAMALVPLRRPVIPSEYAQALEEEAVLLDEARKLRSKLAVAPEFSPERLETAFGEHKVMARLNAIWEGLIDVAPQYVELRAGMAAGWDHLQAVLKEEAAETSGERAAC
jgi:tetratricopeptide (TPR) repeat protein